MSRRLGFGDRLLAWLSTGPVGRVVAFLVDLSAYWLMWVRGRVFGSTLNRE